MSFIKLSDQAAQEMSHNKVKKHYLQTIGSVLLSLYGKLVIEYMSGTMLKISGDVSDVKKAFAFFVKEYVPVMKYEDSTEKTPSYFTITRNPLSSFDGEYKVSKEVNQVIRDRKRHNAGLYEWTPTGATLTKNSDPNCPPEKTWIVKSATGKILGTCRTLNGEGWGFVASFKKQ